MPVVGRLIQLAMGTPVVGYVAYACYRGRIANVFVGQCPRGEFATCFDDVFWIAQPYLFVFLALLYTVPAILLILIGLSVVVDKPVVSTPEELAAAHEAARVAGAREFGLRWHPPWWFSALLIGFFLVLIAQAVLRVS